ncbi:hypothetical protein PAMP_007077 [Pampus punctatissimus]
MMSLQMNVSVVGDSQTPLHRLSGLPHFGGDSRQTKASHSPPMSLQSLSFSTCPEQQFPPSVDPESCTDMLHLAL